MRVNEGYFQRVSRMTGTRYWINNPTITQAKAAIAQGAVGCTTNPAYVSKIIAIPEERERIIAYIDAFIKEGIDSNTALMEKLQRKLVVELSEVFRPIYEESGHRQGYVSIQGDPFCETEENIVSYALENSAAAPNITPKIPVTPDGLRALRHLMAKGIPVNSTEIMSVQQFIDVAEIYEQATAGMPNRAIAFYSHIAGIFDEYLQIYAREKHVDIEEDVLYMAGLSVARKINQLRIERGYGLRYVNGGARGLQHFTEFVGSDGNMTINWPGTSENLIRDNPLVIDRFNAPTPDSIVDELIQKLPDYRRAYLINGLTEEEYEEFGPVVLFRNSFVAGWKKVLDLIQDRREALAK